MKLIILVLALIVGFTVGTWWPNADLTRCQQAVIDANHQGLTGIERNLYIGRDHGCVLNTETGEWSEE